MAAIKNIILDLGGVIINLDQQLTARKFNTLAGHNIFETIYSQSAQSDLFDKFDRGTIEEHRFFESLAKEMGYRGNIAEMVEAWNAMLLDVPAHRLNTLIDLRLDYNTFLLSNTCETHVNAFEKDLYRQHGVKNFSDYFDRVYYSCRIGMRKPEKRIFEFVLEENNLDPNATVFIDDSVQHVKAAGECGIKAYLLNQGTEIRELLKQLGLL